MKIDTVTYSPGSGILTLKCSGSFGIGTEGNPSAELLTRTIQHWIADYPGNPVNEIEIDYTEVDYSWGDGPVSSMVALLGQGVRTFRVIASSSNCDSLKSLLESCNLPWFELLRVDETKDETVLTPVPLKLRIRIPFDETKLSALARDFAERLFEAVPELKTHALMVTTSSSEQCDLLIEAESPTGHARRQLAISVDAGDQEPTVTFGGMHLPYVGVQALISSIERIVHDRLVIAVIVGGPYDGSETFVDLSDPHSLREELIGPYSSGLLEIVSWGGSVDRDISKEDLNES
jgi:hypothetical protein